MESSNQRPSLNLINTLKATKYTKTALQKEMGDLHVAAEKL
jgi:hypothetical protein